MTVDEATKLKPGVILRVPNLDSIHSNARVDMAQQGADFDRLVLQRVELRPGGRDSPLLCFRGGFTFGLFAKDVELCEGPW